MHCRLFLSYFFISTIFITLVINIWYLYLILVFFHFFMYSSYISFFISNFNISCPLIFPQPCFYFFYSSQCSLISSLFFFFFFIATNLL